MEITKEKWLDALGKVYFYKTSTKTSPKTSPYKGWEKLLK